MIAPQTSVTTADSIQLPGILPETGPAPESRAGSADEAPRDSDAVAFHDRLDGSAFEFRTRILVWRLSVGDFFLCPDDGLIFRGCTVEVKRIASPPGHRYAPNCADLIRADPCRRWAQRVIEGASVSRGLMNPTAKKWTLRLIKLSVCAGALWYLSGKVTFRDYARLAESPKLKQRIISETGDSLVILNAATDQPRTISAHALAVQDSLKPGQRPIERGLFYIIRSANWSWTGWAIATMAPIPCILAWRLRYLLAMQQIVLNFRDAVLLTYAGNFFNFAMPGTTGGDVYKAYHVAKRTTRRVEAVTIIILDRAIGMISFLILSVGALLIARKEELLGEYGIWVTYLMLAFFLGCLLFFSRRVRDLLRFEKLLARLPFGDKIRRIDETAYQFRHHPVRAMNALVATFASHFLGVTVIYFLARGFGIHPKADESIRDFYLACLLSTVVGQLFSAVPISVQGFGLMEAVFYRVLVVGGWATASQMLALTLSFRIVQIFWALPGLVVPWLGFEAPPTEGPTPGTTGPNLPLPEA